MLEPVISRKIPYAIVYGNHDDEQKVSRKELSDILASFPYNISKGKKVKDVTGYGNFILEIKDAKGKNTGALLYCMDSNAYSTLKDKKVADTAGLLSTKLNGTVSKVISTPKKMEGNQCPH